MTILADTDDFLSGAILATAYDGFGIRFADVPTTGTHGASVFANDGTSPADDDVELRWEIETPPITGTLTPQEDGSFIWDGLSDGVHSFSANIYVNNALHPNSPILVSVVIGSTGPLLVLSLLGN